MNKLVLASSNPGKLREFRQMLSPLGIEVVPQFELGIAEADEPHDTFLENALAKARHASRAGGLPAFADDSGICAAALNGAPGVLSARYAEAPAGGRKEQDRRNNEKLIADLQGRSNRSAHYYCVIVLVRHAADPEPLIALGRWQGEILRAEEGEGGFGYDPLLFIPELGQSVAALGAEAKNRLSHRALASQDLLRQMRESWHLG